MTVRTVETTAEATALAHRIMDPHRERSVVVVTATSEGIRWFDTDSVDAGVAGFADVYDLPSGKIGLAFSDVLPNNRTVFGGACRVYPRGTEWIHSSHAAPLFTAYDHAEGRKHVSTIVTRAIGGSRTEAAQRTGLTAPIEAVAEIRKAAKSIVAPSPAALIGGRVNVSAAVAMEIGSDEESSSAVPVDVAETPPATPAVPQVMWQAPALPAAGLSAEAAQTLRDELDRTREDLTVERFRREQAEAEHRREVAELNRRLTASRAPRPGQKQLTPREIGTVVREKLAEMDEALEQERRELKDTVSRVTLENSELKHRLAEQSEAHRDQLRTARKKTASKDSDEQTADPWMPAMFPDIESAVRNAIYQTWVQRIPAEVKTEYPLQDYVIGPDFADSLSKLPSMQRQKALRCVVDVLTNLAADQASRVIYPLAVDNSAQRTDGAVCFRAFIERNVAAARRLHFWKTPHGIIELSRVVTHDDMKP